MNFLAFPSVNFFLKVGSVVTTCNSSKNSLFLLKSVGANLIYLEDGKITGNWKNRLNNVDFFRIQNVRQYIYYFHDVAKYEKLSKERKYK